MRDQAGHTPLTFAAANGHCQVLQRLIQCRALVDLHDKRGWTALTFAVSRAHVDCVRLLLDSKISLQKGFPLHMASNRGSAEVVKLLLDGRASVQALDPMGKTALFIAASQNHQRIAALLQAAGAEMP